MKRFYKQAHIGMKDHGYPLLLDNRRAKTPSGQDFLCDSPSLADAIIAEWNAQDPDGLIDPITMPISQFQITKIDFVDGKQDAIFKHIQDYIDGDILFYWADQDQDRLITRQEKHWRPWLNWAQDFTRTQQNAADFTFKTTHDIGFLNQDRRWHDMISQYVGGLNMHQLALFYMIGNMCKSMVLPLAFLNQAAEPEDVFQAACLEEIDKQDLYGETDPQSTAHLARIRQDFINAYSYFELI